MALTVTQRSTPTAVSHLWRGICWSADLSLFCCVGTLNAAATGTSRVMTSPDGITWTARDIDVSAANEIRDVCWAPSIGLFIACKISGTDRIVTSPDGTNWTSRAIPEANTWNSVAWSPGLSIAVAVASSGTNRGMSSTNGTSWTVRTMSANSWNAVCWCSGFNGGSGRFVAGTTTGGHEAYSDNGTSWTVQSGLFGAQSIAGPGSMAYSPTIGSTGRAVAIMGNNDNPVWTSDDGAAWTQRTMPTTGANRPAWFGVCWDASASLFVCVGRDGSTNNNQIAYSADGITWTEQDPGVATPEPWRNIAYAPSLGYSAASADNTTNDGLSIITLLGAAAAPNTTSIAPTSGYTRGGAASAVHTVTINGTDFVNGCTVEFDGVAATSVVFVSSIQVTCVYPAHAAGAVAVKLINPDLQFDNDQTFTYIAPVITSLSPSSGPQTGNTLVTIIGDGFLTGSEITFDGVAATSIGFTDAQHLTCRSPVHAVGSVVVTVVEP